MALNIVSTRQDVDAFAISQAFLANGATTNSDIVLCEGHSTVRILARSNKTMTVRVLQSVTNPAGGPVFIETDTKASVADPLTGEQVIFLKSLVYGVFMRIQLSNTDATPQTAFEISAYLLPEGGGDTGGGAGPSGLDNVVGRSGAVYPSIAAALVGEAPFADLVGGLSPAAGTVPGVVVAAGGVSAVNDFYKDWWLVNQSGTPTNGMAYQFARVSKYVGATKTFTIDKPIDFSAETAFFVAKPVGITMLKDLTEDVVLSATGLDVAVEINFAGHRLEGKIDVTNVNFVWLRGGGFITNGVQWLIATGGVLWIQDCDVSRRNDEIYAVLFGPPTPLGRVVLEDSRFYGRVAGRCVRSGWEIRNCKNLGSADTVQGIPYALVESIAAGLVLVQLDVAIQSEFAGAFLYAESVTGSITGTAYVSVQATILPSLENFFPAQTANRRFAFARAVGAATLTLTINDGGIDISVKSPMRDNSSYTEITSFAFEATVLAAQDFTGTATLTVSLAAGSPHFSGISQGIFSFIAIEGTATMSGAVTLAGTNFISVDAEMGAARAIALLAPVTGTITLSSTIIVRGAASDAAGFVIIHFAASQTVGAPVVTVSGVILVSLSELISPFVTTGMTISVGTWTVSSAFILCKGVSSWQASLTGGVSGGTFTVSAPVSFGSIAELGSYTNSHSGTGGTLTVSGAIGFNSGRVNTFRLASATGAGGTVICSGGASFFHTTISQTGGILARATTATSTARCQGSILFSQCTFELATTLLEATAVGGIAEGPSTLLFEQCDFRSTITDRTGAGTFTWVTATLRWKNCHIEGLLTYLGTSFTTVEAFETRFNANTSEKSITATGTRPTTLRYWDCSFAARFDDLLPEVMEEYDILPAAAALVQGQPVTNNAANQYVVCVAASIVRGASLDAPAGAASRVVAVRAGRIFAAVNAAVVNGDNLALDLVTPTQYTVSAFLPGQNGGFALEAAGATVAGKAYSRIDET